MSRAAGDKGLEREQFGATQLVLERLDWGVEMLFWQGSKAKSSALEMSASLTLVSESSRRVGTDLLR